MTLDPKSIKRGALVEMRDDDRGEWIPLTIISIVFDNVELRTISNQPIHAKMADVAIRCRPRPADGSCRDCGDEAHEGSCIDRCCSECGHDVASRCSLHPRAAIHVYRRERWLAELIEDRPYPTQEDSEPLRRDLHDQIATLRNADRPRAGRVMITALQATEIQSALENAAALIGRLPKKTRWP
jgi:hypothetical protein